MKKSAEVWQFVRRSAGSRETWLWRRVCADGTAVETSESHESFGKAVADALARGFQPRRQQWETRAGDWVTRFAPGKAPVSTQEWALTLADASEPASVHGKTPRKPIPPDVLRARREKPVAARGARPAPPRKPYSRRP